MWKEVIMAWKSLKELMQESLDGYGIEVGTTEPSDPLVKVWINPEGEVDDIPVTKYGTGAPSSSETAAIYVDSAQIASNNLPQSIYFRIA